MKHAIDREGYINLQTCSKEAEIIMKALVSKRVQLNGDRLSKETCDLIVSMVVTLSDAIVESNKYKVQTVASTKPAMPAMPKNNLLTRLYNWFIPPFTTEDFENSASVCGAPVFLTSMDFPVTGTSHPYHVCGYVRYRDNWVPATWNQHGKCSCKELNDYEYLFDLVRQGKRKSTVVKGLDLGLVLMQAIIILQSFNQ